MPTKFISSFGCELMVFVYNLKGCIVNKALCSRMTGNINYGTHTHTKSGGCPSSPFPYALNDEMKNFTGHAVIGFRF